VVKFYISQVYALIIRCILLPSGRAPKFRLLEGVSFAGQKSEPPNMKTERNSQFQIFINLYPAYEDLLNSY